MNRVFNSVSVFVDAEFWPEKNYSGMRPIGLNPSFSKKALILRYHPRHFMQTKYVLVVKNHSSCTHEILGNSVQSQPMIEFVSAELQQLGGHEPVLHQRSNVRSTSNNT